jgi:choline dehydrogenase-like flavoprotein
VTSLENQDGHGHGVKLEATCMMPSWSLTFMNWTSGLDFKLQALKYRHMNSFICITRDRDPGRVYRDADSGLPRIQYTPSAFDRAHAHQGMLEMARMAFVTGAVEIHPSIGGVEPFLRDAESDEDLSATESRFEIWLAQLARTPNTAPNTPYASAHQMGSNRMSVRARDGVVDPHGRVWGVDNLFVADASVFPSASGVNPMITNMAICEWISKAIDGDLKDGQQGVIRGRL